MPPRIEYPTKLIGRVFGRLTVISFGGRNAKGNKVYWNCVCSCGKPHRVSQSNLEYGQVLSCGCLRLEAVMKQQGMSRSPEYDVYMAMRQRCNNPNAVGWENYGGRGIRVCVRWMKSFKYFFKDMGHRPSVNHSIERKNNNLGYTPKNCVWALPERQSRNKNTNVWIVAFGRTLCLRDWAKESGLTAAAITYRLSKGATPEEAVSKPSYKGKGYIHAVA